MQQSQAAISPEEIRDRLDAFWDRLVATEGNQERAYPRVRAQAPIVVILDGEEIPVRLYDIGRGGLQVRCNRATGARIAPSSTLKDVTVTVRVSLPDGGETRVMEACCTLVHVTLLEANDEDEEEGIALGFRIEDLKAAQQHTLEAFILRALEPAVI